MGLLRVEAGQKMPVIAYDNRIELILLQSPTRLRGFLKGLDTTVPREADRPWKIKGTLPNTVRIVVNPSFFNAVSI